MNRREAIHLGAGALVGATATLAGLDRPLAAQAQVVNPTPPPQPDSRYPMPPKWNRELRQLAPNVYAYTQGGGPGLSAAGVSNAGVIVGRDHLVAIDALQGPIPARGFIAAATKATGKPFGRMILTHHHGDHVNGLQFFDPSVEILSHPYCKSEMVKAVPTVPKTWTVTPGIADQEEERHLALPTVTFRDDLVYDINGVEVQFRVVGPAHTWGDVVAYLPQHKIVFLGDVGFFWVAPYANNSWVTRWIDVCNAIIGWDVDVLVPGHGPIGGKKELAEMREYFEVLRVEARTRYEKKMPPGVAAAEIRLGRFDNWIGPERLIMDTVRWYAEWDGTLTPDYNANAVRQATIEYNEVKAKEKKVSEIIPLQRMEDLAEAV
ncbi:MAG: MBL fold metallo-hydrolase [Acidobacteria bacterium]|nr:MBL fold metallo-hydrolase [Acidobacteriota bacterium]